MKGKSKTFYVLSHVIFSNLTILAGAILTLLLVSGPKNTFNQPYFLLHIAIGFVVLIPFTLDDALRRWKKSQEKKNGENEERP